MTRPVPSVRLRTLLLVFISSCLVLLVSPVISQDPALAQSPEVEEMMEQRPEEAPTGEPSGEPGGGNQEENPEPDQEENQQSNPGEPEEEPGEGAEGGSTEGRGAGTEAPSSSSAQPDDPLAEEAEDWSISGVKAVFEWIWEGMAEDVKLLSENMDRSVFSLPEVTGQIGVLYGKAFDLARPVILIALLFLGIMMMVEHTSYSIAYTTQHALPRAIVVLAALSFFPFLMLQIAEMTQVLSNQLFPRGALQKVLERMTSVVEADESGGWSILMIVATVVMFFLSYVVLAVTYIKSFIFGILYAVGPFALVMWPLPGTTEFSKTWLRLTMVCAGVPIGYSIMLKVGEWAVSAPGALFNAPGENEPLWLAICAVCLMIGMALLPFWLFNWALGSMGGLGGLTKLLFLRKALK